MTVQSHCSHYDQIRAVNYRKDDDHPSGGELRLHTIRDPQRRDKTDHTVQAQFVSQDHSPSAYNESQRSHT